ncbi:hypothetical protein Dimus_023683 [Dionaea muscipula]
MRVKGSSKHTNARSHTLNSLMEEATQAVSHETLQDRFNDLQQEWLSFTQSRKPRPRSRTRLHGDSDHHITSTILLLNRSSSRDLISSLEETTRDKGKLDQLDQDHCSEKLEALISSREEEEEKGRGLCNCCHGYYYSATLSCEHDEIRGRGEVLEEEGKVGKSRDFVCRGRRSPLTWVMICIVIIVLVSVVLETTERSTGFGVHEEVILVPT